MTALAFLAASACSSSSNQNGGPDGGSATGGRGGTGGVTQGSGGISTGSGGAAAGSGGIAAGGEGGLAATGGAGGATDPAKALPDGWAAFHVAGDSSKTTGGSTADAAHTYTVTNRKQLVLALYPDAVFKTDGSFTSAAGPSATPKLIYVSGTINLSTNTAGVEQVQSDYACAGFSDAAYQAAFNPKVWNKQTLVKGKPPAIPVCPGNQEELRLCSSAKQQAVVRIRVGSNTTILGMGSDARIIKGTLLVGEFGAPAAPTPCTTTGTGGAAGSSGTGGTAGASATGGAGGTAGTATGGAGGAGGGSGTSTTVKPRVDNVIVRNITFEDSFDYFPAWTPTDSYVTPPTTADPTALYPKCQATVDATSDAGPHQCPGGRWNSEYDNISIANATHVWIDHCTFNDGTREDHTFPSVWSAPYVGHDHLVEHHDGAVDVTLASDFVTITYNVFANHDKTNLIGGTDTVTTESGWGALSVTLHHNYWRNAGQRLPRVRFGKVHTFNNYITGQLLPKVTTAADLAKPVAYNPVTYAMGIGYLAKLYSENNVIEVTSATGDPAPTSSAAYFLWHKAAPTTGTTPDVNENTYFYDAGTTLNGNATNLFTDAQAAAAASVPVKPPLVSTDTIWKPSTSYSYQAQPSSSVKADVMAKAGAGRL